MEKGQNKKIEKKEIWWLPPIFIFVRASAWIAFPVIIALYLGNWLDEKFGTGQKLLLTCIAVAFVISMSGLTVFSLREMKKMKEADKKQSKNLEKKDSTEDNV